MAMPPVVRYMLLCEDWQVDSANPRRVSIIGLLSSIKSLDVPPYPVICRQLCVFLALTEGRGQGEARIVCLYEETGQRIFETAKRVINFGSDPLEVLMFVF